MGFSTSTPWNKLPIKVRRAVLYGHDEQVHVRYKNRYNRERSYYTTYEGVIPFIERRHGEVESDWSREKFEGYMREVPCPECHGKRLKPVSLAVTLGDKSIADVAGLPIGECATFLRGLELSPREKQIAERVLKEVNSRLGFLLDVGLHYLSLDRAAGTLAGGEAQRIRLATQIGSGLVGVLYVLDEPSIGLHQRDNARLLQTLTRLRDLGNTVLVVEHDEDAMRAADHLVDMGPGAGAHGGKVIAEGTPEEVMQNSASLTGQYLSGFRQIPVPKVRREPSGPVGSKAGRWLTIKGATENNLQNVTASIPLGTFTCVSGVSGSGKSTLIVETLYKALAKRLNNAREHAGQHTSLEGVGHLDKIVDIDQSPIGRTPRSNPATYTGAFSPIRDWFSQLPESTERGYKAGRFSFNVKGGRCEACQGDGVIKIEMHFLPDVYVQCDVCKGKRYNRETLEILFRGKSIADVLDMTVDEGCEFFKAVPVIREKLLTLQQVGLGYVHIGQQATTLSGGEAQRVKLAKELSRRATGRTFYILDEPTTGLHFEDVRKLLEVLHRLVEGGNTVLVIEHNLEVIKTADWVLDMGPDGGTGGGRVVAEGPPEEIVKVPESFTGQYLARMLPRSSAAKKRA